MVFRGAATACVDCGVPMEPAKTKAGHDLELCERCGGAWMDVDAFLAELRVRQPGLATEELLSFPDGSPRRHCPRCGETMELVWVELIRLDQCRPHGIWFDRGELTRALRGLSFPAWARKPPRKR